MIDNTFGSVSVAASPADNTRAVGQIIDFTFLGDAGMKQRHLYIYRYINTPVHIQIYTHTYTYTDIYIYTYTYTDRYTHLYIYR